MNFSIKDFFSKCHLLKRSLMENFSFCVVVNTWNSSNPGIIRMIYSLADCKTNDCKTTLNFMKFATYLAQVEISPTTCGYSELTCLLFETFLTLVLSCEFCPTLPNIIFIENLRGSALLCKRPKFAFVHIY